MQNNKLTSLDRHLILKWDGLIEMDLRENPWTCECENQWLVDELMPAYIKINETMAKEMTYVNFSTFFLVFIIAYRLFLAAPRP